VRFNRDAIPSFTLPLTSGEFSLDTKPDFALKRRQARRRRQQTKGIAQRPCRSRVLRRSRRRSTSGGSPWLSLWSVALNGAWPARGVVRNIGGSLGVKMTRVLFEHQRVRHELAAYQSYDASSTDHLTTLRDVRSNLHAAGMTGRAADEATLRTIRQHYGCRGRCIGVSR
jgi:hypothetical protein